MFTVAVIAQKGGVGKTTTAISLAAAAEKTGLSSVVIDLDPQTSASMWKDLRAAEAPAVVATPASRLFHVLDAAAKNGCSFAVIDCPPTARDIPLEATRLADLVLIPVKPAVLDIAAAKATIDLIAFHKKPAAAFLSLAPAQGKELVDAEEALRAMGIEVAPVRLHSRIAHSRAQQTGQVAFEIEPDGKAAEEVAHLFNFVRRYMITATKKASAA